jgi:hypothetical protein
MQRPMPTNRQYRLRSRPIGELSNDDLELHEAELPELGQGEIRVRTTWVGIDPTIRLWMSDMPQYMPPIELGDVVRAVTTGVVEASNHPDYAVGDIVTTLAGWQTHPQGAPEQLLANKLPPGLEPTQALALFGLTSGVTAYFGLYDVLDPKPGETLVVDAAAGAVGSIVGQLGKIRGCRVIGIAGGPDKCKYVTEELGFDACIDHRNEDVGAALDRLCPEGIDMCFENVGGPILDAIFLRMKLNGRISICGLITDYNASGGTVAGLQNFSQILMKRLHVHGFICLDYIPRIDSALADLGKWAVEGKLVSRIYQLDGFEALPDALRELVGGETGKIGKMVVKL